MRVCVPIPFKPEGGGQYFLQAFRAFLNAHGHTTTESTADRFDVLFTNHWLVSVRGVLNAVRHNRGVRIVQRIDGAAVDYGRAGDADQWQHEVNRLADLTIFQSEYCRWSTRVKFPVIRQDGPVIHNPVDLRRFCPEGEREPLGGERRVAAVSWSTNPRKGAASVYALAARHADMHFYLCGRYEGVPALPNVHALGVLDRDRLPRVLRSCHALVTFSEHEACPNHVIEALASGLPVLYADSGAMAEVVGDAGCGVTVDSFGEAFTRICREWTTWSLRSRSRAERCFDPDAAFARYVDVIEGARRVPPRLPETRRWLMAWGGPVTARWMRQRRWTATPSPGETVA